MTKNDLIKVRVSLLEYARHTGFEATESLRILDAALAAPEPVNSAVLIDALHHISLASQNSMSSKADCGKLARDAIAKATPYNLKRIAWELERTAMGDGFYGNALRVAKDIPEVTPEERSLLDRYATGGNSGRDFFALQDLAMRLYASPVAAPQSVSMETVYDTIIEWSTAGKGSRRELARRMIALFAAPPSREWKGLSDDERQSCKAKAVQGFLAYVRLGGQKPDDIGVITEAALRAKNEVTK